MAMPDRRIDPGAASARAAGLRHVTDAEPGIGRTRVGKGFLYRDAQGRRVDAATRRRIESLVIPPAWTHVWIASDANAHLQATGRDARGRKQYRYHARWAATRSAAKYDHLRAFARALPVIRRRVAADLRARPLSRRWVLATVTSLLERTVLRVGNEEYRRANGSYGLTTLRHRHASIHNGTLTLTFRAKSGVHQLVTVDDPDIVRRVEVCLSIDGGPVFQYVDEDAARHRVDASELNRYIRDAAGAAFTAKDFRTWAGTREAARALDAARGRSADTITARRREVVRALDDVAARLGNTRAVCRKCYVHPFIFEHYLEGRTLSTAPSPRTPVPGLAADERALLALLETGRTADARKRVA
jgi:DNA topoisomerase-1